MNYIPLYYGILRSARIPPQGLRTADVFASGGTVETRRRKTAAADPVTGAPFWSKLGFAPTGEKSPENKLDFFEKTVPDDAANA